MIFFSRDGIHHLKQGIIASMMQDLELFSSLEPEDIHFSMVAPAHHKRTVFGKGSLLCVSPICGNGQ